MRRAPALAKGKRRQELFTLLDLCVASLRRGHANLLCIVPILTDDPQRESVMYSFAFHLAHLDSRSCKDATLLRARANMCGLTSAHIELKQSLCWLTFHRWGLAPVALRGHGGEVSVNTLCPASHVDGLPCPNK